MKQVSWVKSKARELLFNDIIKGIVPLEVKDEQTMEQIFASRPEFASYGYDAFPRRLKGLQKIVSRLENRAQDDRFAFECYLANNEVSSFSQNGCIQYQGSDVQMNLRDDMAAGIHMQLEKKDFWLSRPCYHQNYPLGVFCDKIDQEIKTGKYIHQLQVKGKFHKAS